MRASFWAAVSVAVGLFFTNFTVLTLLDVALGKTGDWLVNLSRAAAFSSMFVLGALYVLLIRRL